ncbi:penicillin-binding protein PBP4 [Staphylococcus simiae]|uniref:Penicillin binding protein 4 n=1 Tax=Staphylococcus simiae CCM 7213 = CCUG 51256 TaxID=911238 RepID=G5JIF2_9STAP|nr:penicillin-binding protein PBP4 [Staphylococcus simiae]EHJ08043.1 penicillin binding protein 4 [Staphylococcus simiae CCM 7213 = CCUG 51256]PNZ14564.1 DUF1958 domain-containing protein [Staphylococcus simiae]SNV58097.1 penicillin binding protein 4 [Staphylococcus simiae]
MKKLIALLTSLLILSLTQSPYSQAAETPVDIAKSQHQTLDSTFNPQGMFVTTEQGQILYQYHANKELDPASTAKLMTLYLVFNSIKSGDIHLNDKVKISADQAKLTRLPNLTTVPLDQGKSYTVEELIKQAALESSNAATIILADHVSKDSSAFTDKMNDTAKQLHMTHTHFTNPSGANNNLLDTYAPKKYKNETTSYSTAQDMTVLSQHLIDKHPNILQITKLTNDQQQGNQLHNTNTSLPSLQDAMSGVDGLKTGTSENGYNLVLTAKKDHLRINAVVLNVRPYPSEAAKHARQKIANAAIKRGFDDYEYRKVLSKGEHKFDGKRYTVSSDLYDVVPKDKSKYKLHLSEDNHVSVAYKRQFIPGQHAPSVKAEPLSNHHWYTIPLHILLAIGGLVVTGMLIIIGIKIYNNFTR